MDCKCFTLVFSCLVLTVRSQLLQQESYNYCDPRLKLCEIFTDHTMCKYPVSGPSTQCTKGLYEPLNSTEKDRILYWHNKFRSYVANGTEKSKTRKLPTSSNMRQLQWDAELETIAARWAEQCTSMANGVVYDKCRNTKRFRVSQNVGTRRVNGTSIEKQAPQIVITWYKENKDFDPVLVDKFVPTDNEKVSVKQFSNIIWADTYAIGCARVIFQEKPSPADKESKFTLWTTERLVCNYGPGGNEVGKPIYKRGAPCANCPVGTECSRTFHGLCATQNIEKTEESRGAKENVETKVTTEVAVTKDEEREKEDFEEVEEEEEDEEDYYNCRSGDCEKNIPANPRHRLNDMIQFPQPTARKKTRQGGLVAPGQGNDINIEKRKRTVSNSRKLRRDKSQEEAMKNGDTCKCFIPVDDDKYSSSSSSYRNVFLLLFSTFITMKTFLFSTYHCN